MTTIHVSLGERAYPIYLGTSYAALPRLLKARGLPPAVWVVSHHALLQRFGRVLLAPLRQAGFSVRTITIPESEQAKSLLVAQRVIRHLADQAAMRTPTLLAFGGGVVGDLTGFVAAVFRRGVPYVQLPTTLLAQVDSAIGGKVGVDTPFAKNLVGAFHHPRLVFNHLGVLQTLPLRQRRSGLGEIIKYGVISDPVLFRFLERHATACLRGGLAADRMMIERCCRIKARVVGRDERETHGIRTFLNFGHTLGHALETATGYRRFTHGEAIAVGMACASHVSVKLGFCSPEAHRRLIALLRVIGLPIRAEGVQAEAIRRALVYDKKFVRGRRRWVLVRRIGRVVVSDAVSSSVLWPAIRQHVFEGSGRRMQDRLCEGHRGSVR